LNFESVLDGTQSSTIHHHSTQSTAIMASETTPLVVGSSPTALSSVAALRRARRWLYVSHSSAQFSQQSWEFGLTLFLAALTNYQSLLLVSTYGMVTGLVVCLAGPAAGRYWVDDGRWNRRAAARILLSAQNGSVIITSALCAVLLFRRGNLRDGPSLLLLLGLHVFGALSQLLDKVFLVAMERDWVVVMGEAARQMSDTTNSNNTWLSDTNVAMKQIDLTCRVAAPAVAGALLGASDQLAAAAAGLGLLNAVALVVEYLATARIYHLVPALARHANAEQAEKKAGARMPRGLHLYLAQPIGAAGISLALLYFNVLTFGSLMTAYLVSRGMGLETVALWRGVRTRLCVANGRTRPLSTQMSFSDDRSRVPWV
jgi:solute carrier family 40 (iron-regulated transporter), member 1